MKAITGKSKYYRPGMGDSLLIILILILVGSIASVIALFAIAAAKGTLTTEKLMESAEMLGGNLSLLYLATMLPAVLFIWLVGNAKSRNPLISPVKVNAPHIGKFNFLTLGIVLMLLTLAIGWVVDPITSSFPIPDYFKQMFENIGNNPIDTIISVAILAPLLEEFILRGTIERGLLSGKHLNGSYQPLTQAGGHSTDKNTVWVAIIWSAVLFGVIHLNFWQAIPAFILGCIFGWVYYRTHSIWAVIFMHFVNNFSSILMTWLMPVDLEASSRENMVNLTGSDMWYWVLVGCGAVVTVVCIWLLHKYLPKNPQSFKPKEIVIAEHVEKI